METTGCYNAPKLRVLNFAEDRLSRQEAADYLGLSPNTLNIWACTGAYDLPFFKVGRKVYYRRSDLNAWLERRARGGWGA